MTPFILNERLAKGGILLAEISQCHVLLKNESTFPWFIIVPQVEAKFEDLHDLPAERFGEVMELVRRVSTFVDETFAPDKLNVGCIGNQVRQMHIHVIGRSPADPAWPGVVWGATISKTPYEPDAIARIKEAFTAFLKA